MYICHAFIGLGYKLWKMWGKYIKNIINNLRVLVFVPYNLTLIY